MPRTSSSIDPTPSPLAESANPRAVIGVLRPRGEARPRAWHHHSQGQLVWCPEGPMRQDTLDGVWIVPPHLCVWVPPMLLHGGWFGGASHASLHFRADVCERLPAHTCSVLLTVELREAILDVVTRGREQKDTSDLVPTFVRYVRDSGQRPLPNPFPHDASHSFLMRVAETAFAPERSLANWEALSETPPSELTRILQAETGLSFRSWQRQVRLLCAVQQLAAGASVSEAGQHAGYARTSHWVATFKQTVGVTPGRYFAPAPNSSERPPRALQQARTAATSPLLGRTRSTTRELPLDDAFQATVVDHPLGRHNAVHVHDCGELNWPVGAQSVSTNAGTWVGHEELAVWLPEGCPHATQIWGRVRVMLVRSDIAGRLPAHPCSIRITPGLRQAFLDLIPTREAKPRAEAAHVFLAEARDAELAPLPLGLLNPARTAPMVDALRVDPSQRDTLEEWASRLNMSRRTLVRACEAELGMPFGQFRRLMQIRRAIEWLALGRSVAEAARLVGYSHVPKFIAMFRQITGTTPGRYFRLSKLLEKPLGAPGTRMVE